MESNKKIRILSFQNAYNFGAVLQAYGLQQTLILHGYSDVKFINYNPKYLKCRYNPFIAERILPARYSVKCVIAHLIHYPIYCLSTLLRNRKFKSSISRLLVQTTVEIMNEDDLSGESCDVLVCGSDQIWNRKLTGVYDKIYFGFGNYHKIGTKISYAPSMELSSLDNEYMNQLVGYINNLDYISVREEPVRGILQNLGIDNISVCLDPTLLCGTKSFEKIKSRRLVKKDYILVYAYDPASNEIDRLIKSIPLYEKYEIHYIMFNQKGIKELAKGNFHSAISVEDFLSYFYYSSYVVTNSFHGLAFSILFEKIFNVIFADGIYVRCMSLLSQLSLLDRFIKKDDIPKWDTINYKQVNKDLEILRNKSLDFLLSSINS